jgi:hypothetical protein
MPPNHQPTTVEQQKFVIAWLSELENRLAVFGGAGAKAGYGGKMVVKPSTAYNSLAQAVNKKFPGTSWDGESAKSRVRTMKSKFHNVFTLCGGNVAEETGTWKLSDADKRDGIHTLADKAQSMCPHWNSWLEWCGSDPNMSKHGSGDSGLLASFADGEQVSAADTGDGIKDRRSQGSSGSEGGDDGESAGEERKNTLANFTRRRQQAGDDGFVADDIDPDVVPRAVTLNVDRASSDPSDADALKAQKEKRREMLARMTPDEKTNFMRQEQKEKRQQAQEASAIRRNSVAAAASSPTSPRATATSSSSSVVSPFSGKGVNKDWQASFLAERAKEEDARAEKQADSQVAVAKLQIDAADRQHVAELGHKRDQLSFQQQQLQFQQQHMQLQMQMQQAQQMM